MLFLLMAAAVVAPQADTVSADTSATVISLEEALRIALSENGTVRIADKEIEAKGYARKGTYAALFPQVAASGSFNRTIKKQVMTMDFGGVSQSIEVGRWNTVSGGVSASMPLVNAQLWKSLEITGEDVELAVEKARNSKLQMVTQVKQAYYAVLLAKASYDVYNAVYENAVQNFKFTQSKYNVQKASELDLARAQSSLAAAIPNLYNSENAIALSLWQLKAVMGVDLDLPVDVEGRLDDYAGPMFREWNQGAEAPLDRNSQLVQLSYQAEQLARQIRMQQYAYLPTLSMQLSYNYYTQSDKFNLSQWKWLPSSTLVFNLSIPIFSGGQRYHAIKQTRVQADELELQRQNTERQLRIGIRQSLQTMETAMKTYDAAAEAVGTAEKAYDIASKSYQVGRSTLTDLNNTELTLTQTRLQAAQAIYNFVVAKAGLEQTLGYDFTEE